MSVPLLGKDAENPVIVAVVETVSRVDHYNLCSLQKRSRKVVPALVVLGNPAAAEESLALLQEPLALPRPCKRQVSVASPLPFAHHSQWAVMLWAVDQLQREGPVQFA